MLSKFTNLLIVMSLGSATASWGAPQSFQDVTGKWSKQDASGMTWLNSTSGKYYVAAPVPVSYDSAKEFCATATAPSSAKVVFHIVSMAEAHAVLPNTCQIRGLNKALGLHELQWDRGFDYSYNTLWTGDAETDSKGNVTGFQMVTGYERDHSRTTESTCTADAAGNRVLSYHPQKQIARAVCVSN